MFTKRNLWILFLLAALFVAALAVHPAQVSAAQKRDEPAVNSCLTCHEDLYYLHDTGKWYCITEHKDRCVDCHEGDPTTLNKDASHLGLIAHPQQNAGEKCQQCHQDSEERLATFAKLGGYKTMPETKPYTPSIAAKAGFPQVTETNPLSEKLPWMIGGCLFFGLWLVLVLFSPLKP